MKYIYSIMLVCSIGLNFYLHQYFIERDVWREDLWAFVYGDDSMPPKCWDTASDLISKYVEDNPVPKLFWE